VHCIHCVQYDILLPLYFFVSVDAPAHTSSYQTLLRRAPPPTANDRTYPIRDQETLHKNSKKRNHQMLFSSSKCINMCFQPRISGWTPYTGVLTALTQILYTGWSKKRVQRTQRLFCPCARPRPTPALSGWLLLFNIRQMAPLNKMNY